MGSESNEKKLEKKKRAIPGHFVEAGGEEGQAGWSSKRPGGRVPNNDLMQARQKLRRRQKSVSDEDQKKMSKWKVVGHVVGSVMSKSNDNKIQEDPTERKNESPSVDKVVTPKDDSKTIEPQQQSDEKKTLGKKSRSLPGHFIESSEDDGQAGWTSKRPGGRVPDNDIMQARQKLRS